MDQKLFIFKNKEFKQHKRPKTFDTKMIECFTKLNPPESDVVHSVVTDGANDKASLKKGLKGRH